MKTKDVAELTGYSQQAVRLMAQQGVLPGAYAYKGTGRQWVYQYNEKQIREAFDEKNK